MSSLVLGLGLAVVASLALNGSFLIQHAGSATAPEVTARRPFRTLRGLLASPLWVGGAVLGTAGWGLHVAALAHAPLSLVQAFVAGGLAVVAPIARFVLRQPLDRRERAAVGAMVVALCMLAVGLHDPGRRASFDPAGLGTYLAVAAAFAALLARSGRANVLGLAGGVFYGAADVAIKALTGVGPVSPWLAAAAAATVAAFFCFQRGLQAGRAVPVIALMTGGTNLVSILGGFAVFGDPLGSTPAFAALHAAAFVLVLVAAAALAPGAGGEPGYASARGDRSQLVDAARQPV
jgi:hypothetical protein